MLAAALWFDREIVRQSFLIPPETLPDRYDKP
jgi:hypothetical protein